MVGTVADELSESVSPDRVSIARAGHDGDSATARAALASPDPRARLLAISALDRLGDLAGHELAAAIDDPDPSVRRRAVEVAATHPDVAILHRLDDDDPLTVETTAWSLGERGDPHDRTMSALGELARVHDDPLCREAAVAAIGAIGDPSGLPVVLAALDDIATIRRRAVVALAAFEGPDVEAALERALADRDRQVRQTAEDLLGP